MTTDLRTPTRLPTELTLDNKELFVEHVLLLDEQISDLKNQMSLAKGKLAKLEEARSRLEENATTFLLNNVQATKSKHRLETATHVLTVSIPHTNKVVITDELLIPKEFIKEKVTTTINKEKIKVMIKDGVDVPGAVLMDSDPSFTIGEKVDE